MSNTYRGITWAGSALPGTDRSTASGSMAGLQSAASRLSSLPAEVSSSDQLSTPPDDPSGSVRAIQLRAASKRYAQYDASASDAIGWLSAGDAAYTRAVSLVQDARTLTVQRLSTSVHSCTASAAIADQIDAIRASLIKVANTTYNGRPVFGGTTPGAAAYDSSGNYVGDSGAVARTVGENVTVQINQNGPQAFGSGTSDLFAVLSDISTHLRTDRTALPADLIALDGALSTISSAQTGERAAYRRVQNAQAVSSYAESRLAGQLCELPDIDPAELAVQVTTANVTYQAALETTASVRQLSLLDFLR